MEPAPAARRCLARITRQQQLSTGSSHSLASTPKAKTKPLDLPQRAQLNAAVSDARELYEVQTQGREVQCSAPVAEQLSVAGGHVATERPRPHSPTFTVKHGGSSHRGAAWTLPPPPTSRSRLHPTSRASTRRAAPAATTAPLGRENNLLPAREARRPRAPPGGALSRLRGCAHPALTHRGPLGTQSCPRPSSHHTTKTVCVCVCLPSPRETPGGKEHASPASQHPGEPGSAPQTLPRARQPSRPLAAPEASGALAALGPAPPPLTRAGPPAAWDTGHVVCVGGGVRGHCSHETRVQAQAPPLQAERARADQMRTPVGPPQAGLSNARRSGSGRPAAGSRQRAGPTRPRPPAPAPNASQTLHPQPAPLLPGAESSPDSGPTRPPPLGVKGRGRGPRPPKKGWKGRQKAAPSTRRASRPRAARAQRRGHPSEAAGHLAQASVSIRGNPSSGAAVLTCASYCCVPRRGVPRRPAAGPRSAAPGAGDCTQRAAECALRPPAGRTHGRAGAAALQPHHWAAAWG
ncbi:translation initiation factor IF-2-like [Phyllostomus hastatus]|uniref:translation initiation factor IF-2-like n=1 Tax=Phyllostomus hastatus TaxID=9423 RepID=UPI001E67ECCE|nr:translation initiation factor IF-2-like [Phyllostomus hastatus]